MKKKLFAMILVFIMCFQQTLVLAANNVNIGGIKQKHLLVMTEVAKTTEEAKTDQNKTTAEEVNIKEHTADEAFYKANRPLGYDAYAAGGSTQGAAVFVDGVLLTQGKATSTVGKAYEKGIQIVLAPGYVLNQFKLVCGDKYECPMTAKAKMNENIPAATGKKMD